MSIKDFLLARIAEDLGDHYRFQSSDFGPPADGEPEWYGCIPCGVSGWTGVCRGRREATAKQLIAEEHRANAHGDLCRVCSENDRADGTGYASPLDYPCPTLRVLAAVYDDHPDYRQEWAL